LALAVVFAFLAALGFSSGYVLIRVGTQRVSAPTATFFTVITGAVLISALALILNLPEVRSVTPTALGWFALMGVMAYPLARVLQNMAITMVGATRAAPVSSLQPIFAMALALTILGERPNLLVILGTPIIVCGLIIVVVTSRSNGPVNQILTTRKLGYLLAMGAAASFASRDIISRHVVGSIAPPMVTAAFALSIGAVLLFMLTYRDVINSLRNLPRKYLALCCLAGVCQGLAVAFLFQALSRAPVTVVSPINASSPLITLLLAHLFLQRLEHINPLLLLGTLLSVGGVVLVVVGAVS
jgi:drug/metabolite transporter (DMT)-like permease